MHIQLSRNNALRSVVNHVLTLHKHTHSTQSQNHRKPPTSSHGLCNCNQSQKFQIHTTIQDQYNIQIKDETENPQIIVISSYKTEDTNYQSISGLGNPIADLETKSELTNKHFPIQTQETLANYINIVGLCIPQIRYMCQLQLGKRQL